MHGGCLSSREANGISFAKDLDSSCNLLFEKMSMFSTTIVKSKLKGQNMKHSNMSNQRTPQHLKEDQHRYESHLSRYHCEELDSLSLS